MPFVSITRLRVRRWRLAIVPTSQLTGSGSTGITLSAQDLFEKVGKRSPYRRGALRHRGVEIATGAAARAWMSEKLGFRTVTWSEGRRALMGVV
jgi:hypothetical protein